MEVKKGLKIIVLISLIAIVLFAYLTDLHHKGGSGSFCDINQGVSCDIVDKSVYSEIFGIPVSLLGMLTFVIVGALASLGLKKDANEKPILKMLLAIMVFSMLFSLWLIYAELFLTLSICLLCVIADVLILIKLFLLIHMNRSHLGKNLINAAMLLLIVSSAIVLYLIFRIISEV